ncbi:hypothetical protein [Rhizobium mayense]|uniref:Uncharacterized protein n=1 Tax=Rhizobium mayense TaxID=1312184 RepID=A0ABT7JX43_9HYPH|nr:hypothetical protein [Rhizobium mayense]MDL2400885.1 hypothetical protein [Rhizobium mayense]
MMMAQHQSDPQPKFTTQFKELTILFGDDELIAGVTASFAPTISAPR